MIIPRLRVIAGPNGSGKTTLTRFLREKFDFPFGYYINADEIEVLLKNDGYIDFNAYALTLNEAEVKEFIQLHPLNIEPLENSFSVSGTRLIKASSTANGYFSAILSDFIRQRLLKIKYSFSFETVMSGKDKIKLFADARSAGYRNYLYFICTDDVLINKQRIIGRVSMGEHNVPTEKIESRYIRSLDLLLDAIKLTDRAYIFDNTGKSHELIAEITNGNSLELKTALLPTWFMNSVINKILV